MNTPYIDKLGFILVKDHKTLVVRSHGKDTWYTPGGKREEGETDQQALIREIQEELGVRIKPETITYHGTFQAQAHGKTEGVMVRITCYTAAFEGTMQPHAEIEEIGWFSSADRERTSATGKLILDDLKKKGLID